jgi:hypothetical protein
MSDFVGDAVTERIQGGQPSRLRSIGAAVIIGAGAALLAYRLLRSGGSDSAVPSADE